MASLSFQASLPHPDDTDRLGARLADAVSKESTAVAERGLAVRVERNRGAGRSRRARPCRSIQSSFSIFPFPYYFLVKAFKTSVILPCP